MEEGKDQGINVREKAKQLVTLLKDDERLRNERARALKAKERFAQTASAFGSDTGLVCTFFMSFQFKTLIHIILVFNLLTVDFSIQFSIVLKESSYKIFN